MNDQNNTPAELEQEELEEWLDALSALASHSSTAATSLMAALTAAAAEIGVSLPAIVTPYVNTFPKDQEQPYPGDLELEKRIRAFVRWNAAVMVLRANLRSPGVGGHLATYASASTLLEVGFNHFFAGPNAATPDHIYFQGHAAPGIYARSFVEGRFTQEQLDSFRAEVGGGLPSYPHPKSLPDYWQFSTVSMGLGPIDAIHQAHVNAALYARGLTPTPGRIWCFAGDGEMDEPEATTSLRLAGREQLDNLIFVVNCNLQRLDGPVRGNGKIIQELEGLFRGAGWNVIKVIWGSRWDPILAADDGSLVAHLAATPDGEFQRLATLSGQQIREEFFGQDFAHLVKDIPDDALALLPRGGHDPQKIATAYQAAIDHTGSPTVILAHTVKGWALGPQIESRNAAHQMKKMSTKDLASFRDRLGLTDDIPDELLAADLPPYACFDPSSKEAAYIASRRAALGSFVPSRNGSPRNTVSPASDPLVELYGGSSGQEISTTMAFVRAVRSLLKDEAVGSRIVPIVSDEARTFGMESLISAYSIYDAAGQNYTAVDADLALHYSESEVGRIFEEGISEAGAAATFTAAATAYSTLGLPLLPIFLFYSMFGFQRVGDQIYAAADMNARGILAGCTAGRTTLEGEGLQHADGHSLLLASTNPAVRAYDPSFAYELAVITNAAVKATLSPHPEDIIWYISLYNEPWIQPACHPDPTRASQILEGMHCLKEADTDQPRHVTLLGSGPAHQAVAQASEYLESIGIQSDIWSVTSYNTLRHEALLRSRENMLDPSAPALPSIVGKHLNSSTSPVIAVTDHMRAIPDSVQPFITRPFISLGTDGFGLSDARANMRRHFEVDSASVVLAAISSLVRAGHATPEEFNAALTHFGVDTAAGPSF